MSRTGRWFATGLRDITGGIRNAFDSPDAWVAAALTAALIAVAVVTAVRT